MKDEGITLIALVITVIVLLILAGTAVTIGLDGGGLFERTNDAVEKWNSKAEIEGKEYSNLLKELDKALIKKKAKLKTSAEIRQSLLSEITIDTVTFGDATLPTIVAIKKATTAPVNPESDSTKIIVSTNDSEYPVYMWIERGETASIDYFGSSQNYIPDTLYWWTEADKVYLSGDCSKMFEFFILLSDISSLSEWDVSNVTNMSAMFAGCWSLTNLNPLSGWDTSHVTDMSEMFDEMPKLADLSGISGWDVSNVKDMHNMFSQDMGCEISNLNALQNWDVSNVTNMSRMFFGCNSLTNVSGVNNWDISNVSVNNFDRTFKYTDTNEHIYPNWNGTWDEDGTFTPASN